MTNNTLIDVNLAQDAYVTFDALSLKDFIIDRLNKNENFTDQIYEGSNLSSIIDIVAYSYHVLMFYLNSTASESTFSQATLYENINKIVNLVGYKPTGKQTSVCSISAVADTSLPINSYFIRKYSYFLINDIQYTFLKNINFSKTTTATESLQAINDNVILYQGTVQEYPAYTASGVEFETLPVVVDNIIDTNTDKFISEGTISVYVKEKNSNKYYEYTEINTLYLAKSYSRVYDLRLNENGNYEIKFGNGIFGRRLNEGDEVIVYYLLSDNTAGIISKNSIRGNKLFTYSTGLYETIHTDTNSQQESAIVTNALSPLITFTNPNNSTEIGQAETVEEIKKNTPMFVSSNLRLVTSQDYTSFISKNLNKFTQSIYVASNEEYINDYINYFYNISVDPNKVNRILLNQVNFADSCDFNNINVFCVPSFRNDEDNITPPYLSTSFKNLIVDLTKNYKTVSAEVVPRDPIYVTFKVGITNSSIITPSITEDCKLTIVRQNNNKIQKDVIKNKVITTIRNFFNPQKNSLGQNLLLSNLTASILGIEGVKSVRTTNTNENINYNGVSFLAWNTVYPNDDITQINQDTTLPFYKFPYLYYPNTINNYIEVIDE
jgi:hypothetical protein